MPEFTHTMAGKYNKNNQGVRQQGTNVRKISYVLIFIMIVIYGMYHLVPSKRTDSPVYDYRSWKTQEFVPIPQHVLSARDSVKIKTSTVTFTLPSNQKV